MIRIAGVTLPEEKQVVISLTSIYGIGRNSAHKMLVALDIPHDTHVKDLSTAQEQAIREYIESNMRVEGELRREVAANIKHHKDAGTWRGVRHTRGLPVRGQRTKTNSRTVRGNVRRTAGSGRRSASEKT